MAPALKVREVSRDAHALARTKKSISKFKRKEITMKKYLYEVGYLMTFCSLMAGYTFADAAKSNDNFTVRFRENTLVVASTHMEEARIYSMEGKLLQKEKGTFVEFPLDRGTYRLYAKVDGETLSRRIELR